MASYGYVLSNPVPVLAVQEPLGIVKTVESFVISLNSGQSEHFLCEATTAPTNAAEV